VDISKPADDRSVWPGEAVGGGIFSLFHMVGDFSVTVNYALLNFPMPPDSGSNEAHLSIGEHLGQTNPGFNTEITCRLSSDGENYFFNYGVFTPVFASDVAGQMRVERVGSTYTSLYCPAGATTFTVDGRQRRASPIWYGFNRSSFATSLNRYEWSGRTFCIRSRLIQKSYPPKETTP
jgi:hypothetical protein